MITQEDVENSSVLLQSLALGKPNVEVFEIGKVAGAIVRILQVEADRAARLVAIAGRIRNSNTGPDPEDVKRLVALVLEP